VSVTRVFPSHRLAAFVLIGVLSATPTPGGRVRFLPSEPEPVGQTADETTSATVGNPPDAAAFESGLGAVRSLVERRRWNEARERLLALVDEHVPHDYVRAARPEILQFLERCAFWNGREEPEIQSLVSGKVLSYKSYDRKIRIAYTSDDMDDFEQTKAGDLIVYRHPMLFAGRGSLEVTGLAGELQRFAPMAFIGPKTAYAALLNRPEDHSTRNIRHQLLRLTESDYEVAEERKVKLLDPDEEVRAKLTISGGKLLLSYQGSRVFTESVPRDEAVSLGFTGTAEFDEVVLEGQIESSWVDGQIDTAVEEQKRTFLETYDPRAELPEWLREAAEPTAAGSVSGTLFPGAPDRRNRQLVSVVRGFLDAGEEEAALEYIRSLPPERVTEAMRRYLRALALLETGEHARAEALLAAVVEADPTSFETREQYARVLLSNKRYETTLAQLEELVARHPQRWEGHRALASQLLRAGRPERAAGAIRLGLRHHPANEALRDLNVHVRKARNGPGWNKVYSQDSEHYSVASDLDKKICRMASRELEGSLELYSEHLGPVTLEAGRRFQVYLFSGFAGYESYVEKVALGSAENTAGLYLTLIQQLLIWNVPQLEDMLSTIRHEGLHQYVDARARNVPIWFNEGLAEYFEVVRFDRRGAEVGVLHERNVEVLERRSYGLVPLRRLLAMDYAEFYRGAELHYAQSWAFIHMLRETTPAHRRAFDTLWNALVDGVPDAEAHARAFEELGVDALDRSLREYVKELGD